MRYLMFAISIAFAVMTTTIQVAATSGRSHGDDGVRIPANLCSWSEMAWNDFNSAEQSAWSGLGWTKPVWDGSDETAYPASYSKSWSELAGEDKKFATELGYSSKTYGVEECPNYSTLAQQKPVDPAPALRETVAPTTTTTQAAATSGRSHGDDGVRIPANLCSWSEMAWNDFNSAEQSAWSGLGWTKPVWDGSDETAYPASYSKSWSELAGEDKKFATELGYSSKTYGVEGCPDYSTLAQQKQVDPAPPLRKTVGSTTDFEADAQTLGTSGVVEIYGSYSSAVAYGSNDSDANDNYTGGGGGGSVNFWLNDNYTLQIDGNFSFFRNAPDDDTGNAIEMLVHTGWRSTERGYFGAFGGFVALGQSGADTAPNQWVIGGEGAVYWDMLTVFVQGGFMDTWSAAEAEAFTDTYFVRGGARYFFDPNLKLEASGGFLSGDEYTDTPVDMPFWRAEVEYKPDDARVSWFGAYMGYSEDEVGYEHTNHTVMGGIRIHIGQDTLMSVDRSGASQGFLDSRILQMAWDQ